MEKEILEKIGIENIDISKYGKDFIDLPKSLELLDKNIIRFKDGSIASTHITPSVFQEKKRLNAPSLFYISQEIFDDFKEYILNNQHFEIDDTLEIEDEIEEDTTEIKRLVENIVYQAIKRNASDIHFHPKTNDLKVMLRIDGVMQEFESYPKHYSDYIVNKIKTMARMDATQRLVPQDGKMKMEIDGHEYEFRVSTVPTIYGEDCVLRIQQTESLFNWKLESIGFEPEDLKRYRKNFSKSSGLILNVGATGSGKTTTFYLTIKEIVERFKGSKNIITVEDPVEIKFEKILQIEVDEKQGRTFPVVLRSLLRQDPDIILIGEIRDEETAEIGVRASITGHLVMATLHANDSFNAITRLRDLGLSDQLIASTLNCILSQKLVRKLCSKCKEKIETPIELKEKGIKSVFIYEPKGCKECNYTGYKGRTAVIEVLEIDDDIKSAISDGASEVILKKMAKDRGFNNLWINGLKKVEKGETSYSELISVIKEDVILNKDVEKKEKIDVGTIYYPDVLKEVMINGKKGYLYDISNRGLSLVFDEVYFLEIDKTIEMEIENQKILFTPKSYRKLKDKWIVGGLYKGNLKKLVEG